MTHTTAVIVAGGKGLRMGMNQNKQFIPLQEREVIAHTISVFEASDCIQEVILVTAEDNMEQMKALSLQYDWRKVRKIVVGGAERQDSVWCGLQELEAESEIVLIHDGARPFVTQSMIKESIEQAKEMGACVVGMPVKDTIKVCDGKQMVLDTPNRQTLWQTQTPQTFQKELIQKAYAYAREQNYQGTDDSSLVEYLGEAVLMIQGSYDNIKITTRDDLLIAMKILEERA